MNQLVESLQAKTAGLPNWVWAGGAGLILALLLFRGKSSGGGSDTTSAVTSPSIIGGIPVTTGGGSGTSSSGDSGTHQPCPGFPNCGPAPSPAPGGATPPSNGPPGSVTPFQPPAPPAPLVHPFAAFNVSPLGVTPGHSINVDVYSLVDADSVEVWASGSSDGAFPSAGFQRVIERPKSGVPFTVQIDTTPYQGKQAVYVHLDLKIGGQVVATGNPNMGGYDATLQAKVLLF